MKPVSISEQLMYNTVRIVADNGLRGTGSFFEFKFGKKLVPVIITNRHIVDNEEIENKAVDRLSIKTTFCFHTISEDSDPEDSIQISHLTEWIFHKNKDLCFCFTEPIFKEVGEKYGKGVFFITVSEKDMAFEWKLQKLSALEEITMVGYPNGLWDERNNFPIFRRGYTATHPAIDFNEDGIGLADIACFDGSSGSPIFLLNEGSYIDKYGIHKIGTRFLILGYLYMVPKYGIEGKVVDQSTHPQQKMKVITRSMMNLGYYIKSSELRYFKTIIESELGILRL